MTRKSMTLAVSLILVLVACNAIGPTKTLTVSAAASLTESFSDLGRQFEAAHPGAKVIFNFAGSQQLVAQLELGARADVFASASVKDMNAAISASLVASGTVRIFAHNQLVIIYPPNNPGKIAALTDLARPQLKLIIADAAVPVGQYTLDMLTKMSHDPTLGPDFEERVLANVVSREENVKSVISKIRLGEGDAGVVYKSDVTGQAAQELGTIQIPESWNQIAIYPIAPLTSSPEPELARQFIDLVLSPTGQKVLTQYGFIPVQKPKA